MNKNETISIEISLKEAQGIWNTGGGCFYHEQPDRFIANQEDEELLKETLTMTEADKDTHSFLWVENHLEALVLAKVFRANGYVAIDLCDECWDSPYVILVNVPMDALSELR